MKYYSREPRLNVANKVILKLSERIKFLLSLKDCVKVDHTEVNTVLVSLLSFTLPNAQSLPDL